MIFKRNILILIAIWLLFSCTAHKDPPIVHPSPPVYKDQSITRPESSGKIKISAADLNDIVQKKQLSNQRKIIAQNAINSLGLPYKWGGQSPETGFDCSGLIVYTYKKANIIIPRTTKAQFNTGKVISKKKLQVADLVFFQGHEVGKITHVGVYIGDGIFIHAPGRNRHITYGYMNNSYFKKNYLGSRTYL